jgi:uncharacterized membrane protein
MQMSHLLAGLEPIDFVALGVLVAAWFLSGFVTEHPPSWRPSVSALMKEYRREWMRQMLTRQPRIFDATMIDSLRQGTTFFASAAMIAIGGGVALIGNAEKLTGLAADLTLDAAPLIVWQVRLVAAILFLTDALLKFVWAHRLFGYSAIVMAAVPNDPAAPGAEAKAAKAAEINIQAAKNFNRGLRSVFFALGALGWLLGPEVLLATTAAATWAVLRREFWSHSHAVLASGQPGV